MTAAAAAVWYTKSVDHPNIQIFSSLEGRFHQTIFDF